MYSTLLLASFRPPDGFLEHERMRVWNGTLEAFREQGYEGLVRFAVAPDEPERDVHFPVFIEAGDELEIFAANGRVVWRGTIAPAKPRLWDRRHRSDGLWSETRQAGVSYRNWMDWFNHDPPLRARLTRPV